MRTVGIILVILGALGLGYQGFTFAGKDTAADARPAQAAQDPENSVRVPPVAGGIAVVSGLLLLATGGRKDG